MIDVLGRGDHRGNVTLTVTLSKFTGTRGAYHGLDSIQVCMTIQGYLGPQDRGTLGWSYRPVCVS